MSIQPEHPQIAIYKGNLPIKLRDENVSDGNVSAPAKTVPTCSLANSNANNANPNQFSASIYKGQNDYDRLAELKLSN